MKKQVKIFSVRDRGPNGSELFRGNIKEVTEKLHCSHSAVYEHCKNEKRLFDRYFFVHVGAEYIEAKPKEKKAPKLKSEPEKKAGRPKVKKPNPKEENYQRILKHLDIYGNTSSSKDPIKMYGNRFAEDGYIIDVYYRPEMVLRPSQRRDREVWPEIWIITLIKKVEVNK